ncbi:xyloglucan endotransglucosylase/hydrolase protein 9-like [Mangifera indica]|uniref:xyloglucan endotransglucosylase/hydrolase protein 9-like n=1 Tax=Mangifera indica TaxID=29780 RepID=UPI001CFB449F|nr:xyloglucan endotransglucosylase/hydrolase protein 9-like [Mangifera indica]
MSSDGPNHNEFDFEFLGNTTGEPHLVQTNLHMNGVGNRKQRVDLWFVPTKDSYTNSCQGNESWMTFTCPLGPIQFYRETCILCNVSFNHRGLSQYHTCQTPPSSFMIPMTPLVTGIYDG